jgi:hypothetical protein
VKCPILESLFVPRPLFAALMLASCFCSARAFADETAYCRMVRARAASDADLLMSPRVLVQGIRYPRGGQQLDSGPMAGTGYQVRTALAFSPLDFYKGLGALHGADADCARHQASVRIAEVIAGGPARARVLALRAQAEFLRSHTDEWRALAAKSAARLAERIITIVEFNGMQHFIDTLEHKLVQREGEANELEAETPPLPDTSEEPLGSVAARYHEQTMRFEREASQLRRLDGWKFQLTGGVIPLAPVDWYGVAEVSFSLGVLVRDRQEERYLDARAEELRSARDDIEARLERFRTQMHAALERAQRDLAVIDHSIEIMTAIRLALEKSETESVAHARDTLTIEQISVESDGVFQRTLVDALAALAASAGG